MKKVIKKRKLHTKIISYRCKGKGVISGKEAIVNQLRLGNKYRNELVQNEQERRTAVEAARDKVYPQLPSLRKTIAELIQQRADLRQKIKDTNAKARCVVEQPKLVEQIGVLVAKIKEATKKEKKIRQKANKDAEVKSAWEILETLHNISKKGNGLRDKFSSQGLQSGTYQLIEKTVPQKGDLPKFHPTTGEGKCRIYLGQKGEKQADGKQYGYSPAALLAGKCKECRIELVTRDNGKGLKWQEHECTLLVSNQPVVIRFNMDRELPADCEIREVCLLRRRIATHWNYRLQFTIAKMDEWEKPWQQADTGMVGIDVGYRLLGRDGTGGLRVATWKASDGKRGEIVIPWELVSRQKKVEDLQSIRSKNYTGVLVVFKKWLATNATSAWIAEKVETIAHWKSQSQARLAGIVLRWRHERFKGDKAIYEVIEAWRVQDKHLYEWQESQRKADLNWRLNFYREQLQSLAKLYKVAVIEEKLASHQNRLPEQEPKESVDRYRNLAANGMFHRVAIETFAKTIKVDSAYTTSRCHYCGETNELDKAKNNHTCVKCGKTWDLDENAGENLLHDGSQMQDLYLWKDSAWHGKPEKKGGEAESGEQK